MPKPLPVPQGQQDVNSSVWRAFLDSLATFSNSLSIEGVSNEIDISNGTFTGDGTAVIGIADNPVIPGSQSITVPVGTTAGRPTPAQGMFRFNSTTTDFEGYDGTSWVTVTAPDIWNTIAGDSGSTTPNVALDTLTIAGGTNATTAVSGDTLTVNVDDSFILNTGDVGTGSYDFGGATSFEIPNSATPTVVAAGEVAVDTSILDHTGLITYHDGVEALYAVALPTANLTATDGHVVAYNATNNEFEMVAGGGSDTFATIQVDGLAVSTNAPTLDFASADFTLTELPTDDFDITINDSGIDHNATTNYVANEHIDWTSTSSAFSTSGTAATGALTVTGNIIVTGTVDGRDVATDGTKLDGVEASADVTDEANVTSALDGATLTAVTVATGDKVLIQDASDLDNLKTVTAQSIADLGPNAATQAEMEAASSTSVYVSPGRQHHHPGSAKGWVKCDTAAGVNASYNVTSVTDNGTGDVTVNWDTDFSTADYCAHADIFDNSDLPSHRIIGQAVGTTRMFVYKPHTSSAYDPDTGYFISALGDH